MAHSEERFIYRIIAQKKGITITAETANEMTMEEAKQAAIDVLGGNDKALKFEPFVVVPIATKERWDRKCINFCPRCGANLKDYELEQSERFECFECGTSMNVHIHSYEEV